MRKMWSFLLAALALTGCAAAPADALPAAETAETAEMTTTETEEAAAQPVGFTVGNLSEVPNTCGGYWGWSAALRYLFTLPLLLPPLWPPVRRPSTAPCPAISSRWSALWVRP